MESILPYTTAYNKDLILVLLAFCISSITGAFHWYVDFMDDDDEGIYTKRIQLKRQRQKLRSLLRRRKTTTTTTSKKNIQSHYQFIPI